MTVNDQPGGPHLVRRHSLVVRVTHWINVACLTVLLMSGLQIFNAHPALYFGKQSTFNDPALSIGTRDVGGTTQGVLTIAGHSLNTTGVLGLSTVNGKAEERGFPSWITLPGEQDLGTGRRWHFLFAWIFVVNGLVYLINGIVSRHFARDLVPRGEELKHLPQAVVEHARLHFPKGEEARHYNVLQKLAYAGIVFLALPLIVLAGWTMSPGLDALFPQLLDVLGGRQSARTIHFLAATSLVLFVIVHVVMVLISGVWNNMRSMVTGWYDLGVARKGGTHA